MKRLVMNLVFSSSVIALAACGGDDGSSVGNLSCGTAPCGGDPVGEWTIEESCVSGEIEVEQCPDLVVESFSATQTGSVSVSDDNSYSLDTQTVGSASLTFPASCFGGLVSDCSQLDDEDTTCTGDASTECNCDVTIDETSTETGTWSVDGTQITLDDGAGNIATSDFCVDGNAMAVINEQDGITVELLMTR